MFDNATNSGISNRLFSINPESVNSEGRNRFLVEGVTCQYRGKSRSKYMVIRIFTVPSGYRWLHMPSYDPQNKDLMYIKANHKKEDIFISLNDLYLIPYFHGKCGITLNTSGIKIL